jgi:hypothetical protein
MAPIRWPSCRLAALVALARIHRGVARRDRALRRHARAERREAGAYRTAGFRGRRFKRKRPSARVRLADVSHQHRKFIAAETTDDIGGAHISGQRPRHAPEQTVARSMTEAVVDHLETIKIKIDERRRGGIAGDIGERPLEFAGETTSVQDVGGRIDVGARLEPGNAKLGV